MNNNWIIEQTFRSVAQFDQAMVNAYPDSNAGIQSETEYLKTIVGTCNYIAAAELVDWARYLQPGARLLDMGCGGGWLSAMLSRFDSVQTVYALDSSQHFLHKLLPQVMVAMQGRSEKLVTLEGLFQPLLLDDGYSL